MGIFFLTSTLYHQGGNLFRVVSDEEAVKEILSRLPISSRDQKIIQERIYYHKARHEIAGKFGLSTSRIAQIERTFWVMLWGRSLTFERYYREKQNLDHGVYKYRLYNPEKIHEIAQENRCRRLSEYDFSNAVATCLYSTGIKTIGQLVRKTVNGLLRIRNLGPKRIQEIKDVLSRYGYSLKEEDCYSAEQD